MQFHLEAKSHNPPCSTAEAGLARRLAIQLPSLSAEAALTAALTISGKARALQAAVLANKPTALVRKQLTAMLSAYGAYLDFDPDPRCVNVAVRFRVDDGKPDTWRRAIIFR